MSCYSLVVGFVLEFKPPQEDQIWPSGDPASSASPGQGAIRARRQHAQADVSGTRRSRWGILAGVDRVRDQKGRRAGGGGKRARTVQQTRRRGGGPELRHKEEASGVHEAWKPNGSYVIEIAWSMTTLYPILITALVYLVKYVTIGEALLTVILAFGAQTQCFEGSQYAPNFQDSCVERAIPL